MIHREETIQSETIYEGKLITLRKETVTVKVAGNADRTITATAEYDADGAVFALKPVGGDLLGQR